MREIAIRGFANEKFNTSFGKGLFRRAVFNGSVELASPSQKYLVDFYTFDHWEHLAKSDVQMDTVTKLVGAGIQAQAGILLSWLLHYEPLSKTKTPANGYCIYAPNSKELHIAIDDPTNQTQDEWTINVHNCKATGTNKPVFIATNVDLH